MGDWHALPPHTVLRRLETTATGLASAEAAARLARYGPNVIAPPPPAPWWTVLAAQLRGTVTLLLIAAAAIALASGHGLDAAAVGVVLLINIAIGFSTELPARRAIEALRALEAPTAVAWRDGRARELAPAALVPGDVILLDPGAAVPADARLLEAVELRTVEAALTGESLPVKKEAEATVPRDAPLAERPTMVYQGTTVAAGQARAAVVATGGTTELGRIGKLVEAIVPSPTPLERRLDQLGRRLAVVALAVAAVVGGLSALQGAGLADVVTLALALAVAAVPEGLPAVATITLAVGVRRMARRQALVRRLPVVETLGAATVICTDKTGTLTTGQMTAVRCWVPGAARADQDLRVTGAGYAPAGQFLAGAGLRSPNAIPALRRLAAAGALATRAELRARGDVWEGRGDPTDVAFLTLARKAGEDPDRLNERHPPAGLLPFASERQLLASYHRVDGRLVAYVKGAPHAVLDRCTAIAAPVDEAAGGTRPLDDGTRRTVDTWNSELATAGLRVLAVAEGRVAQTGEAELCGLRLLGLVGLADPPAQGVEATVRRFREAGIRTVLITGDQHRTAVALGRRLGLLEGPAAALEGAQIDRMDDAALAASASRVSVASRVTPEGKLRLIRALQRGGEAVAMLGDGVNDAAALRQADIGVAMGRRGTDVAKQAAAVVLRDDRFETIGTAIAEGRVIADNIRKFVFYLFSCNLAEILVFFGAALAGWAAPLLPLQILWLNLVTDTFPALALALEPGEPDLMRRPPADPRAAILGRAHTRAVVGYAVLIAGVTLTAFAWGLAGDAGHVARATTLAFVTLGVAQILHLGNARSPARVATRARAWSNRYALAAAVGTLALQVLAVEWAPLAGVLHAAELPALDWMVVFLLGAVPGVVGQLLRPQ